MLNIFPSVRLSICPSVYIPIYPLPRACADGRTDLHAAGPVIGTSSLIHTGDRNGLGPVPDPFFDLFAWLD